MTVVENDWKLSQHGCFTALCWKQREPAPHAQPVSRFDSRRGWPLNTWPPILLWKTLGTNSNLALWESSGPSGWYGAISFPDRMQRCIQGPCRSVEVFRNHSCLFLLELQHFGSSEGQHQPANSKEQWFHLEELDWIVHHSRSQCSWSSYRYPNENRWFKSEFKEDRWLRFWWLSVNLWSPHCFPFFWDSMLARSDLNNIDSWIHFLHEIMSARACQPSPPTGPLKC